MCKIDRLGGGLYGLLIGDAHGVPYEFHPASAIPALEFIDMRPPARFRRSHASVKPGTWSDDGALALCLLDSLIEKDGLDLANLAAKFLAWDSDGIMAVDGYVSIWAPNQPGTRKPEEWYVAAGPVRLMNGATGTTP